MALRDDLSDDAGGNATASHSGFGCFRGFWRDRCEQAAGCLRVEKKGAKFLGDAVRELDAALDEFAIVFHSAGEEAAASCLGGAGKVFDAGVIDFQRYAAADRHFAGVAEHRKAGHISDG